MDLRRQPRSRQAVLRTRLPAPGDLDGYVFVDDDDHLAQLYYVGIIDPNKLVYANKVVEWKDRKEASHMY